MSFRPTPGPPGGGSPEGPAPASAGGPVVPERETSDSGRQDGPLHARIRKLVLHRILEGELEPGDSIGVSRLAAETGISRTPVREALLQLRREGFLTLEENRGFFVRELTEEEARELYPILHALEDLALTTAGRPSPAVLAGLESLNERLAGTRDPKEAIALNFRWHALLTGRCTNAELQELLRRYRMRVYRYELAYYRGGRERVAYSAALHGEILAALRAGDLREARSVLARHWVGDYSLYLP